MVFEVCRIDPGPMVRAAELAAWQPAGDKGAFAMISRPEIEEYPLQAVVDQVMRCYPGGTVGRMLALSRLVPGQAIEQHIDRHDDHCTRRVHVPLLSNPSAVFLSGKSAMHMAPGFAYEIDPTVPHSAANAGDTDRIHLFWNVVAA